MPDFLSIRCVAAAAIGLCLAGAASAQSLYVNPDSSTVEAVDRLEGEARRDALLLSRFPSATWFTAGTPEEVEREVARLVDAAHAAGQVPVLVAYNIPLRDCALYSAGGAEGADEYVAWIRGFAAGIGGREAIVALEPDAIGVVPWHRTLMGEPEACRPDIAEPDEAAAERFSSLGAAVGILADLPRTRVYLDGTGSSWLAPGETVDRLARANIAQADGFFLNVSNFESDARVTHYARWVSDCLALVTAGAIGPRECPSQYDPADFADVATWGATDAAYDALFAAAGLARDPASQKRAIVDSSRNGTGSWSPPEGKYSDAEVWCNPPDRGLGRRPTLDSGDPYVDAFLWIKIPGESDGECYRGTAGPMDPERGVEAPRAGGWFAAQARELIRYAEPPLTAD
ncbi:glycoside hydrolase family 6 protein [Pelagerythrobacter sp.]|uniref:glycoside hydrolase family 6 protein n=1 Tax=Pelagerythrobacter sp. TaxID=2800702 RepID=UPI0035B3D60B